LFDMIGSEAAAAPGVMQSPRAVNLNRFTSLSGFFNAAHDAGKHTFTIDPDYLWYGMLLRKV
jgi:hypothetical protein